MPLDPVQRDRRRNAIRAVLRRFRITSQGELLERLKGRGFTVTQSSVSRDLRDLDVIKDDGRYRLPETAPHPDGTNGTGIETLLRSVMPAGPNLCVVHTAIGAASRVGLEIDDAAWPGVVGTVAGDDTLFVAVPGRREQVQVMKRIQDLLKTRRNDD
jgi:transcriptional regulator of arginine metabolism